MVEEIGRISTPNLSDALDKLRIKGGLEGITPIVEGVKMVGRAYTVRFLPAPQVGLKPWPTYIDQAKEGDVIVIDNGGRTYCTIWGGILTLTAKSRGIRGTVIDGVCRDVPVIKNARYPVFTKGRFVMTGKDRLQLAEVNGVVEISHVMVRPGDIVVGDDSGVVVIPMEKAEDVAKSASGVQEAEDAIVKDVEAGTPLTEARRRHRYGELQRPEK